jgi:hypothetical protein
MLPALRILVVKRGGYLKAILPDREETIFGRDEGELIGRLNRAHIPWSVLILQWSGAIWGRK